MGACWNRECPDCRRRRWPGRPPPGGAESTSPPSFSHWCRSPPRWGRRKTETPTRLHRESAARRASPSARVARNPGCRGSRSRRRSRRAAPGCARPTPRAPRPPPATPSPRREARRNRASRSPARERPSHAAGDRRRDRFCPSPRRGPCGHASPHRSDQPVRGSKFEVRGLGLEP